MQTLLKFANVRPTTGVEVSVDTSDVTSENTLIRSNESRGGGRGGKVAVSEKMRENR